MPTRCRRDRETGQFAGAGDTEFACHLRRVVGDGLRAQGEPAGAVGDGNALGQQPADFEFARGQRREWHFFTATLVEGKVLRDRERDPDLLGRGMPRDVGQRFLDDAITADLKHFADPAIEARDMQRAKPIAIAGIPVVGQLFERRSESQLIEHHGAQTMHQIPSTADGERSTSDKHQRADRGDHRCETQAQAYLGSPGAQGRSAPARPSSRSATKRVIAGLN